MRQSNLDANKTGVKSNQELSVLLLDTHTHAARSFLYNAAEACSSSSSYPLTRFRNTKQLTACYTLHLDTKFKEKKKKTICDQTEEVGTDVRAFS